MLNNLWSSEITESNYGPRNNSSLHLPVTLVWEHLVTKSAVFKEIQKTLCKTVRLPTWLWALEGVWHIQSHVSISGEPPLLGAEMCQGTAGHRKVLMAMTNPSTDDLGIIYVIPKDHPASLHSLGLAARWRWDWDLQRPRPRAGAGARSWPGSWQGSSNSVHSERACHVLNILTKWF